MSSLKDGQQMKNKQCCRGLVLLLHVLPAFLPAAPPQPA
jgi:hypothetical protein